MVFHSAEQNYKTHLRQAIPSPLNLLNPLNPLNLHAAGVSKGDTTTLGPKGPIKPKNPKNLRPARAVNPHAAGVSNLHRTISRREPLWKIGEIRKMCRRRHMTAM